MKTLAVGITRIGAAACATFITAVCAWAFVQSTASIDRDPFHFAAVMRANAEVHATPALADARSNCSRRPQLWDNRALATTAVCRKG